MLADLYLCTILPFCYSQHSNRCKLCWCQSRNWVRCGCYECVQTLVCSPTLYILYFWGVCCFVLMMFFFTHHIESKSQHLDSVECFLWRFSFKVSGQSLHIGHGHYCSSSEPIQGGCKFFKIIILTRKRRGKQKNFLSETKKICLFSLFNYDFAHE